MGDKVFNVAKARERTYLDQVGVGNAALIAILLKGTGLEADGAILDHATVAALLAASNDECDFTGYARKTITSVTGGVDNANDWYNVDTADLTWTTAGGAVNNTTGAIVWAFDPDTTTGTDTTLVPVFLSTYVETTTGGDIQAQINAQGLFRAP